MNKQEIEAVIQVLKKHIDSNETLLENGFLNNKESLVVKKESSACVKAMHIFETLLLNCKEEEK